MSKVIIIISTDNTEVASIGFTYAINAIKNKWLDDIEIILFGPIERKIAKGDEKIINYLKELIELGKIPYACKKIAEDEGLVDFLKPHTKVEYVGKIISNYIKNGYLPLVF